MIKSLHLENYGRFRDQTFTFAPVTVFSGNNETGKTTLFDALLDVIAPPKATSEHGKRSISRYGKDRKVIPEPKVEHISMTDKDFLNLFAIRSGEISLNLDIEDKLQWMNQVKASLFSGGIDPKSIAMELKKELDNVNKSKSAGTLGGDEKITKANLENLKSEKKKLEDLRQKCTEDEKGITDSEKRLAQIIEEISQAAKLNEELEKSVSQQELWQNEKVLRNDFNIAVDWRSNKEEQEKNARYTDTIFEDFKKQEDEITRLRTEANKAITREEETMRLRAESSRDKARCEEEKSRRDSDYMHAAILKGTLVPREKLIHKKTHRVWRKPFLIAAGLLLIAGILTFFLTPYGWGILAIALGAAGILIAIAQAPKPYDDTSALDEAVRAAREKWKNKTGEDAGPHYEDILAALDRAEEKSRAAMNDYNRASARSSEIEQEVADRAMQKTKFNDAADDAQRRLRKLLDEAGAADVNDYAKRLERKSATLERGKELNEKMKNAQVKYGAASLTELESIIGIKLNKLLSETITETELSAPEQLAMKKKLEENRKNLDALNLERIDNTKSFSSDQATIRERLRGLPEKIAANEKNIREGEEKLVEIERQMRAKKIAMELFDRIAEDSSLMFEELSQEIGELFTAITETGRKVTMENFSMKDIKVTDAQGRDINITDLQGSSHIKDFLSAGTLDAFLLAARLVLARKSLDSNARAIIVLDDPFLTLDRPRTSRALSVLKDFHKTTHWQLILFTKDEETVNQARAVFGSDLCVHELC